MQRLILKFKDKILNVYPLDQNSSLTIGRHPKNDIFIEDLTVSGFHARIDNLKQDVMVKDLDSKNGLLVNNETKIEAVLRDQDQITIGKYTLLLDLANKVNCQQFTPNNAAVTLNSYKAKSTTARDKSIDPADPDTPAKQHQTGQNCETEKQKHTGNLELIFLEGGEGIIEMSGKNRIVIGKDPQADILIDGMWGMVTGSAWAIIYRQSDTFYIRFADGLIRPKHNGSRVRAPAVLNHDDLLELGPVKIKVQVKPVK
ncbi:MAG: FHA domain-containing protein [Desulfobacteraceae bacterium]|nr:FHA domain-containing protein [Desulfobacteraceae bacterium]